MYEATNCYFGRGDKLLLRTSLTNCYFVYRNLDYLYRNLDYLYRNLDYLYRNLDYLYRNLTPAGFACLSGHSDLPAH